MQPILEKLMEQIENLGVWAVAPTLDDEDLQMLLVSYKEFEFASPVVLTVLMAEAASRFLQSNRGYTP